jgi:hypothetical protein
VNVKDHNDNSEFPEGEFPEGEFLGLTDDLAAYGQYLDAEPLEVMPTSVWEQISTTLSLQSADRIVPDSPAALGSDPAVRDLEHYRKHRVGGKWVGGLVAASVTLFAVGIGVNVLNSDTVDQNSVVAGAQSAQSAQSDSLAAASPQVIQAGFVPPAVEVMESGSDYNSTNLRDNVTRLLSKLGIKKPMDIFMTPVSDMTSKKMTKATGMTGSLESLRNCLNQITKSESSQAIFVDRATFQGMDAGVIVIPMVMFKGMDTLTTSDDRMKFAYDLESSGVDLGALDVWVVGPNCGTLALDVYSHVSHSLK